MDFASFTIRPQEWKLVFCPNKNKNFWGYFSLFMIYFYKHLKKRTTAFQVHLVILALVGFSAYIKSWEYLLCSLSTKSISIWIEAGHGVLEFFNTFNSVIISINITEMALNLLAIYLFILAFGKFKRAMYGLTSENNGPVQIHFLFSLLFISA